MKRYFHRMRGGRRTHVRKPLSEIFWSWLGGFSGIFAIWQINYYLGIQENTNLFLIGSFGASAVLIYGAPISDFSQPRNLVGGHVISALTGVIVHLLVPDQIALAGALAVSLAIATMLATHTTHPPGGATALIAVTGGESIFDLGFRYVMTPILVGVLIMLLIALIVNNIPANEERHYPRFWF
jgi:CBS domain-containing membrane protein